MSCDTESLLTEESISNQTAGAYFSTPSGFEDLSKSIYPLLRPIAQLRALTLNGTDIFSRSGGIEMLVLNSMLILILMDLNSPLVYLKFKTFGFIIIKQ